MSGMHLKQPGFMYSALQTTKKKERIQKFKETRESRYIYLNEIDKVCFQHDMAYGDFKDLPWIIASDKELRDKTFNIAKNLKFYGCQPKLALLVLNFFKKGFCWWC